MIGYRRSAYVMPRAKGVADVTTESRRAQPGRVAAARPVRKEPSWGRVLLTTVELWVSRRLNRRPAFPAREASGPRRRVRWPTWAMAAVAFVAAVAVTLAALQLAGAFSRAVPQATAPSVRPSATGHVAAAHGAFARSAAAARSAAVAWMASQVTTTAVIGCYPALCGALQAQGVSASRLVPLGSGTAGVSGTDVVATLPSALSPAGQKLLAQYAPALIANFGAGSYRIEIRAVAHGGSEAYQSALRADLTARMSAGAQLLRNSRIGFSAASAAQIRGGQVDARLLATLAALSSQFKFQVSAFGDSAPGVAPFFRQVMVAGDGGESGTATLAAALAMVNEQGDPYRPARATVTRIDGSREVLVIQFAMPSPLGLLTPVLTAYVKSG
jgi:hypothetical protein